jgi:hypothetical protein
MLAFVILGEDQLEDALEKNKKDYPRAYEFVGWES